MQVMDASYQFPQTGQPKQVEGEATILGRNCRKLTIESENDFTTYYYSQELTVNKEFYNKHNFGNWNLFLNSTKGALALKYEINYLSIGMRVVMEAYEIEEIELELTDFDINSYLEK